MRRVTVLIGNVTLLAVLVFIFLLYTDPHFMRRVSDTIWFCFG